MIAVLAALHPQAAYAFRAPVEEPLQSRVVAPAGFVATVVPVELSRVLDEVPADTLSAVSAFEAEAGPGWRFYVDRRSGGMALAEGRGLAFTQSLGSQVTLAELEAEARGFMQRYPALFRVRDAELVLDRRGTVSLGERGQFWSVVFRQTSGGIPVEGARVVFRVANGKLVQFGVDRTVPVGTPFKSTAGLLSASQARNALSQFVGNLMARWSGSHAVSTRRARTPARSAPVGGPRSPTDSRSFATDPRLRGRRSWTPRPARSSASSTRRITRR
jgi:hypothetical protein